MAGIDSNPAFPNRCASRRAAVVYPKHKERQPWTKQRSNRVHAARAESGNRENSGGWQYYDSQGRQVRESSKSENPRVAERMLKRRLAEAKLGLDPAGRALRYDDIRASYLRECVTREDKSLPWRPDDTLVVGEDGLPRMNPVDRLDAFFGRRRLKVIRPDLLDEFVEHEKRRGLSNGTINRSMAKLRAMFNAAKARGDLRDADIPPKWPVLPEALPRQGFFERDEYRALLAALPDELKPLLAIGYATGMRSAEIRNLRWEQVDFLGGVLRLNPGETKNNLGRTAPLTSELHAILTAHHATRPAGFPFVCFRLDRLGRPHRIGFFHRAWNEA